MKKVLLFLLLLALLSGCAANNPGGTMTEKNAPDGTNNFNEADVMSRINEIKNGATPKVKPTGESSSANQPPAPPVPPAPPATDQQVRLENLSVEYSQAIIKTNFGDIQVVFYADVSPITVNNFLNLAKKGFYNGTKFHRIISDFMIQGGDPLSADEAQKDRWGTGGPGYKFQDEFNEHKLVKGSLAMANSGPGTNGSQFFIVTKEATSWLDGKHTNFGYVAEGMDVVDKIDAVETDERDRPVKDVVVEEVELVK